MFIETTYDGSSDRNESVNTSQSGHSKKTQGVKLAKFRNVENKRGMLQNAVDRSNTRKMAGKHISIILNRQNRADGEDIDIKISNRNSLLKSNNLNQYRRTAPDKRSQNTRNVKRSL